ncbi:MAG: helix-turn-helix domain-containing protein [Pseudomonadales bacterium]|jgi:putative transcriptional regulator|nr:helix-turn-helix domain-containing protein [Pseudomonadales bacterium]
MKPSELSPAALCAQLGERIKRARLNQNLAQKDIAEQAGLSVKAVQSVESGTATLLSTVAVLQALDLADHLQLLLPEPALSPRQLVKLKGKERRRASGSRSTPEDAPANTASTW